MAAVMSFAGVILMLAVFRCSESTMSSNETRRLRDKALEMFDHAYNSYMLNAFPADELMPLTCQGRFRGNRPSRGDVDESLGNFTLTLVDTLDTLALLNKLDEFETAIRLVIERTSFDTDVVVSVFETNIRMLGGLLGGHVAAVELKSKGKCCDWYTDQLLQKALDLGNRLLLAFSTTSGIPYPKVNLKYGLKGLHFKDTCTACAGTMVLEFAALSRLTRDPRFEDAAHKAMDFLWEQRNINSNLMGTVLNVNNGNWVRRESGIGAGIDSYYEYLLKAYVLLGETQYLTRFNKHYGAIMTYINRGPIMLSVDMHKPTVSGRNIMDALLAFWPGLQVLKGDLKSAIEMHEVLYQITQRHNFLPEAVTADFHVHWAQHPLRPEFVESTYFLYKATGDPHYLEVGKTVLDNLEKHARVACGFAAIKDVRAGSHEDQMDSFVLAETFKYLYLLFEDESNLVLDVSQYIFTTEAHLLPLSLANHSSASPNSANKSSVKQDSSSTHHDHSCPNINEYKGMSTIRYAEMIRSPLKNYVELKCPKPKPRKEPVRKAKHTPEPYSQCHMAPKTPEPSIRAPRLRAADFSSEDIAHSRLLKTMGVLVAITSDGRVQLTHSPNEAKSDELAEEGLSFMQEMISLAQDMKEQPPDPRVVQILDSETKTSHVFAAGSAQFGWDFNPPAEGTIIRGRYKSGIKATAVLAEPPDGCKELSTYSVLLAGRIAVVERGGCIFIEKVRLLEKLGAVAVIVVDNTENSSSATGGFFQMSGDGVDNVKIPAVFLFHVEGSNLIKTIREKPDTEIILARRKIHDSDLFPGNATDMDDNVLIVMTGDKMSLSVEVEDIRIVVTLQQEPTSKSDRSELLKDDVTVYNLPEQSHNEIGSDIVLVISIARFFEFHAQTRLPIRTSLFEAVVDVLPQKLKSCSSADSYNEEQTIRYLTSMLSYLGLVYKDSGYEVNPTTEQDVENIKQLVTEIQRCNSESVQGPPTDSEKSEMLNDKVDSHEARKKELDSVTDTINQLESYISEQQAQGHPGVTVTPDQKLTKNKDSVMELPQEKSKSLNSEQQAALHTPPKIIVDSELSPDIEEEEHIKLIAPDNERAGSFHQHHPSDEHDDKSVEVEVTASSDKSRDEL